jgi:uncharacterized protein (TIGR00369 family)
MPRMTRDDLDQFIQQRFPEAHGNCEIIAVGDGTLEAVMPFRPEFLRPGGTISGPALMGLADVVTYYLVLAMIGPVELAVTTSLNINFMRKPLPGPVRAVARLLKLGKQLAIAEVHMTSVSSDAIVAQATVTYSIPPGS